MEEVVERPDIEIGKNEEKVEKEEKKNENEMGLLFFLKIIQMLPLGPRYLLWPMWSTEMDLLLMVRMALLRKLYLHS